MSFLPAGEFVRTKVDITRDDGMVVIPKGTSGRVQNRDEADFYWILFKGATETMPVYEHELEIMPGGGIMETNSQARAWIADAMKRFGTVLPSAGQFGRDCPACRGPLVAGEGLVCRGCSEPDLLDDEVLDDLVEG